MKRIIAIAFTAAAISTLALSAAQAGLGGVNGISPNGLNTNNGLDTHNGVNSTNGIILNGLGSSNGINSTNGTLNGISVSETVGQTILEIRLTDGTVARR